MKQRRYKDVEVVIPRGYLDVGEETYKLDRAIKELVDAGNKKLLVNLGETRHLNSTALGVLISAHSNYVRRGGFMRLCCVDKRIQNIFQITKLSLVFDQYGTEEQALAAFEGAEKY